MSLQRSVVYAYWERGQCSEPRPVIYTGRERTRSGRHEVHVMACVTLCDFWVLADELCGPWLDWLEAEPA